MTHDTPPKRIWEDRMTDLTREQLEALLDGSINDHLDYDHDTGEVYLLHQGVIAESVQPCDGPLLAAAPDLARQLLATMIERDEAQAAQALVVERACLAVSEQADWPEDEHGRTEQPELFARVINAIRSLADPTGVKLLAEVRAERDELRRENGILRGNAKAQGLVDEIGATGKNRRKTEGKLARTIEGQRAALRKLQGVVERHKTRAEAAEAQLAEAQKREADYQEALIWCGGSDDFQADGKARAGWLKLCAPLIDRAALSAAPTGEESNG